MVSFTASDYECAVENVKGIVTSSPKPTRKFYTDFFPISLVNLPSPIQLPKQPNNQSAKKVKRKRIASRVMWISKLDLKKVDKEILQSDTGWLNDSIIDAAQILLKSVCPGNGFQPISVSSALVCDVQRAEFIQILNTGTSHWVTISTIGTDHPTVNIYDSLYSSASDQLQEQIASLLITPHSFIVLNFIDVQLQSGESDCGIFAVAYATALAFGQSPQHIHFDQKKMRKHLVECFENRKMTPFPMLRQRRMRRNVIKTRQEVAVHCSCRLPEMNKRMIECSNCKQWFHITCCKDVPNIAIKSRMPWFCCNCSVSVRV